MPKKIAVDQVTEFAMKRMGNLIKEVRGKHSLRKIAEPIGIPASQLQYIERGTLAPTAEVYIKLLDVLKPNEKQHEEMDQLYMTIRKTPPPDVCQLIISNPDLIHLLRVLEEAEVTNKCINTLITSVIQKNIKGVNENG